MYEDQLDEITVDESPDNVAITVPEDVEDQPDPKDPFPVTGKPIEPNHPAQWRPRPHSDVEITD